MSIYRQQFPKKAFLPVIHVESPPQTLENVGIAFDEGADGVFLINHQVNWRALLKAYMGIREEHFFKQAPLSRGFIGLNMMDVAPMDALHVIPPSTSALWVDDGGMSEAESDPARRARWHWEARKERTYWGGLFFGSVAFKYRAPVRNPARLARLAMDYMDVIVTSGVTTGSAPSIDKIRSMRSLIGSFPLAIASGITCENVASYLPFVDCFMVATGISDSSTQLNRERTRRLAELIHAA